MNKILLVIQREYLTRVRKKSFLIMTILGPLLMGGIFTTTMLLDKVDTEIKTIAVVDETHIFNEKFKDNDRIKFVYPSGTIDSVKHESVSKRLLSEFYIFHLLQIFPHSRKQSPFIRVRNRDLK